MRVLFDTNIIIDFVGKRIPFYEDSSNVFKLAIHKTITGIVGAGSITDVYYLARRNYLDSERSKMAIVKLIEILVPVDTKAEDIDTAIKLEFSDFEDAVICATAIREKADYILTRNVNDFANSPVKAITPAEFLKLPEIIQDGRRLGGGVQVRELKQKNKTTENTEFHGENSFSFPPCSSVYSVVNILLHLYSVLRIVTTEGTEKTNKNSVNSVSSVVKYFLGEQI
jgi:predicted nucleic acid-binding protein